MLFFAVLGFFGCVVMVFDAFFGVTLGVFWVNLLIFGPRGRALPPRGFFFRLEFCSRY